jgi:hypothetical protein
MRDGVFVDGAIETLNIGDTFVDDSLNPYLEYTCNSIP